MEKMSYLCHMIKEILTALMTLTVLAACHEYEEHKTVICIPVYGQSLALGEEAVRITDLDSLAVYASGRIVTENLDHRFGYFDNNTTYHLAKKLIHYHKRSFELTIYSMAKVLADSTGADTLICIFPGGQGTTPIASLQKGSVPYQHFLESVKTAYDHAKERGWDFTMPALCWMQGESDVADSTTTDYRALLLQFYRDINHDVRQITKQQEDVEFICYQTNPETWSPHFDPLAYHSREVIVPQTLLELVRDSAAFHASGPLYPYHFVREAIHIDAAGHRAHGRLVARAALDVLHGRKIRRGLLPLHASHTANRVVVTFNVPCRPLVLDTIQVRRAAHYGFSVVTKDHRDIAEDVILSDSCVHIICSESADSCRIRYAINGEQGKIGQAHGPRGNLRDVEGNWCWQFDMPL